MKLTVQMHNNTYIDRYYLGESAVSYYLEDGDVRLLFDAGYSDAYLRNVEAMGIDLSKACSSSPAVPTAVSAISLPTHKPSAVTIGCRAFWAVSTCWKTTNSWTKRQPS